MGKSMQRLSVFQANGERMAPPHGRNISLLKAEKPVQFASCLVNSTLILLVYSGLSDCEHINDALTDHSEFPILGQRRLGQALESHVYAKRFEAKLSAKNHFIPSKDTKSNMMNSMLPNRKPIIDEIDRVLAPHYGFTERSWTSSSTTTSSTGWDATQRQTKRTKIAELYQKHPCPSARPALRKPFRVVCQSKTWQRTDC